MREWTLSHGDPLALTLAADFRLCSPDYLNDHIWEMEIRAGDPPALSLRTTYGLRACSMRIFPRFSLDGQTVSDPVTFPLQPRLRHFFPNFLSFDFSPFPGIDVTAEYWTPNSQIVAGRFTITNRRNDPNRLLFELCGQLLPLEGQSLAPRTIQLTNILTGRSSGLAPVIFLTGGPRHGPGPFLSLALDIELAAGATSTRTWVQAALSTPEESFELARLTAARQWETERARIEMVNAAQTFEVYTGDPDWDAAFALSQKTAFSLFFGSNQYLPHPSFVHTRQPDQGYSPRGDGTDYPHLWNGQPALEACTLASLLPGAPELAAGLVRNFLSTQSGEGVVDWKPGLAGQRGRWLAAPLLASLAWKTFQQTRDMDFLREVQPGLEAFTRSWLDGSHDHDRDGFPEWEHALQSGLEDNPAFSIWQVGGQGAEISTSESPALTALLCRETQAHACIAGTLNQPANQEGWELKSEQLRILTEECWDPKAVLYHIHDRDTHSSPAGKKLGTQPGNGTFALNKELQQPARLLVRIELKGDASRRLELRLLGQNGKQVQTESLERKDFQWAASVATASTRKVYTRVEQVKVSGLEKRDRVSISVMDYSTEDVTLFLPLLARIPDTQRALSMVNRTLLAANRFGRAFGIPLGTSFPDPRSASVLQAVHLPWNMLIGEGLLGYGLRAEAAQLTSHLMTAVIQNMKQQHAFARAYNAESGAGIGERNHLHGLAPLGLFLDTLGVYIESRPGGSNSRPGLQISLSGKNPFPWSVTVKYRGLLITRHASQTIIVFSDGQTLTLDDPTDAVITTE